MSNQEIAIQVSNLTKMYKLYDKPSDRLKEALGLSRKKRYHEHLALNNVDMTIYKGETVGIIGTNGSGKSTILKIITGVLSPTSGEVTVEGHISALLELGAGFNPEYNGIDNIFLQGMMIGFSEDEIKKRMNAILDFADIGDYVYQPVKTYSSGMFVRLAFAVAINIDPEILIVDEALSVGDVFFQAKCYHKFEEFKKQGKTILFVSHDLSSISKYCDRAILLNQGVKLGEGSPKEMIDIYKRVLVGQYELPQSNVKSLLDDEEIRSAAEKDVEESDELIGTKARLKRRDAETGAVQLHKEPSQKGGSDAAVGAEDGDAAGQNATNAQAEGEGRNPNLIEYGDGAAQISEIYITDNTGKLSSAVEKGTRFTVHMTVTFAKDLAAPIFAYTIKNTLGIEITGTNTMVEKAFLEPVKAGDVKKITFAQDMQLQGGEYLLSFGVTGFENGAFTVYHRLYDALNLTVVSDKNTVGYYDMNSVVEVTNG